MTIESHEKDSNICVNTLLIYVHPSLKKNQKKDYIYPNGDVAEATTVSLNGEPAKLVL
jgi:hypothetical protein